MTGEHDTDPLRGTAEWVIAVVCTTLAKGTPTREVEVAEVEEAGELLVSSFREVGEDNVVSDDGVWSLAHLGEGEAVEFAREIVGAWLKTKNLEIRWDGESGGAPRVEAESEEG